MTMTTTVPRAAGDRVRELDWLMLAVVCLCCLGIVMAVSVQSVEPRGHALLAMKSQGTKLVAGIVLFIACAAVPLEFVRRKAIGLFVLTTGAVFAAALFGPEWNGAQRWISIGGRSVQPVDFARIGLVLITAAMIARAGDRIGEFRRGLVCVLAPTLLLTAGLFLQPDNGNGLLCIALGVAMALSAGVALRWMGLLAALGLPLLPMIVAKHDYVLDRLTKFWHEEPIYQVRQSVTAIETGGLLGVGVGDSYRKLGYVPEAHNDFVFSIVGEELGFLGSASVVALYIVIGVVGCRLAMRTVDPFHRYIVFGCSVAICAQAAINLLVTTGLAPAKGIDLPFVSAGGTNLVASLGAIGLIGNAVRSDLAFDRQEG